MSKGAEEQKDEWIGNSRQDGKDDNHWYGCHGKLQEIENGFPERETDADDMNFVADDNFISF